MAVNYAKLRNSNGNSAWATNGRGTAINTLNSYKADHQSPVVIAAYRPYRLKDKKKVQQA